MTTTDLAPSVISGVSDAARLVGFALRPKLRPARDETYTELIRRFRTDDRFAELVRAITLGLDLVVLDAHEQHGLVVASADDSVFAVKMGDYAKRTGGEHKAAERVLHGAGPPRRRHAGLPAPGGPVQPRLRRAHHRERRGGVRARGRPAPGRGRPPERGQDNDDPSTSAPDLEAAWRVYTRRAASPGSGDGRRVSSSTVGMVGKAMTFLCDQGMLTRSVRPGRGHVHDHQPLPGPGPGGGTAHVRRAARPGHHRGHRRNRNPHPDPLGHPGRRQALTPVRP